MRAPIVIIARRFLIGVILLVIFLVLGNYIQTWRHRPAASTEKHMILSREMSLSAEGIEYSENRNGTARFKLRANKRLETLEGKNYLQGIDAFNFNPDGSIRNSIHSQKAEYDRERRLVDFSGKVKMRLGYGIELLTDSLHYDQNACLGVTKDPLQLHSSTASGSASGVRFDQENGTLELISNVDFSTVQKRTKPDGSIENVKIHATSETAFLSESIRKIQFQSKAHIETGTETLDGDVIEAIWSADQKHILSLTSIGHATYKSQDAKENRSLNGDLIEIGMDESNGAFQNVRVTGKAAFSSISNNQSEQMNLSAAEIYFQIDPVTELPIQLESKVGVQFDIKDGNKRNRGAGDYLRAAFASGTKQLETIDIKKHAIIRTAGEDLTENELQADTIRLFFREADGRTVLNKFQADGSAQWMSKSSKSSEISKKLTTSSLVIIYSNKGEFPDNGIASGDVVLTAIPPPDSDGSFLRQLRANTVRFHFYPGNSRIRDMDGDGRVRVNYEKKTAKQNFHTESDNIQVKFQLSATEGAVEKAEQWGNFHYIDESKQAFAGRCDYDAAKELMVMSESPRIVDAQMGTTSGAQIVYNQKLKIFYVNGGVKSIISSKKGDTSPLGSDESAFPTVTTADAMQYSSESEKAIYTGNVLLLSNKQRLQSERLEILNGGKQLIAQGQIRHFINRTGPQNGSRKKKRNSDDMPISVQGAKMNYARVKDADIITYSGNVYMQSTDYDIASEVLDIQWNNEEKKIIKATARDKVVVHKENRVGKGEFAEYYLNPERFEIFGSPAKIDDPTTKMRASGPRLTFDVAEDSLRLLPK
jgi:LPS export ABC transporter protein LptC